METSHKGKHLTATIQTEKPLTLGQEYKSVLGVDGFLYMRVLGIIDRSTERLPCRYVIHYRDARVVDKPTLAAFTCLHCEQDCLEFFDLKPSVRRAAGIPRLHCSHLKCAERVLGRRLRITDFSAAPANDHIRQIFAMGRRKGRKEAHDEQA